MAHLNSMFLFEIILEEVKTFLMSKQFIIRAQFSDIFSIDLKNPADKVVIVPTRKRISKGKANQIKEVQRACQVKGDKETAEASHSILFASNVDRLMSYMLQYPIEITLWSKENPQEKIGSTHIPWHPVFVQFMAQLYKSEKPTPVVVEDLHNVFDEYSSRRIASIKLNIKLSCIKERIVAHVKGRSREKAKANTLLLADGMPSKPKGQAITNTAIKPITAIATESTIVKTIYSGKKQKRNNPRKCNREEKMNIRNSDRKADKAEVTKERPLAISDTLSTVNQVDKTTISFVKSETDIIKLKEINVSTSKSCSSINKLNTLLYVFGDLREMFGNRIYTVGYFTVTNPNPLSNQSSQVSNKSSDKSHTSSKPTSKINLKSTKTLKSKSPEQSPKQQLSESMLQTMLKYKFELCNDECPTKITRTSLSEFSIDLPKEDAHLITITKCKDESCKFKKDRDPLEPPDHRYLIDMSTHENPCCVSETATLEEHVVGSMAASMKIGPDPCYCACECTFDILKTTYCKICGGYEKPGEDTLGKPQYLMPFPCPEFHELKNKAKTGSTSGSESHKKDLKTEKKKKKDDRFKFHYGFTGIPPRIGHSQCGLPCSGNLNNVPKCMGWLWNCEDDPARKFHPQWKPGAISKFVLRLLRMAKNPGEVAKKRRKDTGKKKRPIKRPLLVVHKKDGEFTITMETMKVYTKPRALNQQPFEDKPVITYTIGRTEEENRERRKKKERAQRRLEREQRAFIQGDFKDLCQEICLKTYQQALEILPDAEDPKCTCYPSLPGPERIDLERSCSCSEDSASLASDTDSDEWIVEFTPPNAYFDPIYKGKKIMKTDRETQYTYLDFRVKLFDHYGNPIPRWFKGIDGKQICSDLGGFWGADHQWQQINVDGIVGPDGRWAPLTFTGPNGEQVDIDTTGKFQAMNGNFLVVGVDGYIDSHCKWKFYARPRQMPVMKKRPPPAGPAVKKGVEMPSVPDDLAWRCFGNASTLELTKMGILGHGVDKKLLYKTRQELIARGEKDVKMPRPLAVPPSPARSRRGRGLQQLDSRSYFAERQKCHHSVPSDKGIVLDARGNKSYYKLKSWRNSRRPEERIHYLSSQGKSVSTFHEPCYRSFIDSETIKVQQRERLMRLAKVTQGSQTNPHKRYSGRETRAW